MRAISSSTKKKSSSGTIVIRTGTADALLPQAGQRVNPSYQAIVSTPSDTMSEPSFLPSRGAKNYRLVGLELTMGPSGALCI